MLDMQLNLGAVKFIYSSDPKNNIMNINYVFTFCWECFYSVTIQQSKWHAAKEQSLSNTLLTDRCTAVYQQFIFIFNNYECFSKVCVFLRCTMAEGQRNTCKLQVEFNTIYKKIKIKKRLNCLQQVSLVPPILTHNLILIKLVSCHNLAGSIWRASTEYLCKGLHFRLIPGRWLGIFI